MMREFIGLDSTEICKELALSTTNLHVQLHRARLSLQKCLDTNWFKEHHMLSCYKATALISLSHERPLAFREKSFAAQSSADLFDVPELPTQ